MTTERHDVDVEETRILDELERCVEEHVLVLPVLSHSRHSALVHAATVFENALRLQNETSSAMIIGLKYGLNHLVGWIQDNCAATDVSADVVIDAEAYSDAQDALVFAYDYDWNSRRTGDTSADAQGSTFGPQFFASSTFTGAPTTGDC